MGEVKAVESAVEAGHSKDEVSSDSRGAKIAISEERVIKDDAMALAADVARQNLSDEDPNAFDDSHLQVDREKAGGTKKKKNKKKKPKSKRGLSAPTGFEEYSADTPITPAEYVEQRQLYDLDFPFTERIITAIHRYEHRRKMTPVHRDIFYKYLAYGGLDVGPNMFQGLSPRDADSMDKETFTRATAQTALPLDFRDIGRESSNWVVDFEGVMKGFLSRRIPYFFPLDTKAEVHTATNLLSNFMNYLLHHDVCPEYRESILSARALCTQAAHELWSAHQAGKWLPGDFNIACSTLFGGVYSQRRGGEAFCDEPEQGFVGQTDEEARQIVKFAVACAGTEKQYQLWYDKAMADQIKVTRARQGVGLEITEIKRPDDETRDFYKQKTKDFRPVGKIYTKGWKNPAAPPDDLTPEEQTLRMAISSKSTVVRTADQSVREADEDEYEFFIEEAVLQYLAVGMKLEVTVRTLNCGIYFFDEIFNVYLSMDTFLPNEMMYGHKKERYMDGFSVGEDGSLKYSPESAEEVEGGSEDGEAADD